MATVDSEGKIDEHSDVEGGDVGDDDPSNGVDEFEESKSRRLRQSAFAIVVYASGDRCGDLVVASVLSIGRC